MSTQIDVHPPHAPSERRAWLTALGLLALGVGVLVAVLGGALDSTGPTPAAPRPPAVLVAARTPAVANGSTRTLRAGRGAPVDGPYATVAQRASHHLLAATATAPATGGGGAAGGTGASGTAASGAGASATSGAAGAGTSAGGVGAGATAGESGAASFGAPEVPISTAWEAGFYPIYAEAQHVFGVNWLLLASIHDQETAFSTAPGTYHGLNFAHCCGGPMQFNVTNGPTTTWQLVQNAYRYGRRPATYDHRTSHHPSIYDDFDAIMAAAWLLSSDGAGAALDDPAWWAAYDYYGHGVAGVAYADQVLARAISWSQHGFCTDCGVDPQMVSAVEQAYGAPVLETLEREAAERARHARRPHHARGAHRR